MVFSRIDLSSSWRAKMRINLVSNLGENFDVKKFNAYNHVIAYNLREALLDSGHDVQMIRDHDNEVPFFKADHTVVISAVAMNKIHDNQGYKLMLRANTEGKFCLWLDAAFSQWGPYFDLIFTVVPPYKDSASHYRWVGYAADPAIFYPAHEEKTVFVDSYMWGWYGGIHDWIYRIIQEVLEDSGLRILQPVPIYNKGRRATWPEMIEAFRASHFHVTTQVGNFGLTNIEATTCGALLVIHENLNEPRSWPFPMPHVTWKTREDLEEILTKMPDIRENRIMALEHSWRRVALRLLEGLNA